MKTTFFTTLFMMSFASFAGDLKVNDPAPNFSATTQENKVFKLDSRKGAWTVLYFYPQAETPGCTQQACAFRDNISKIRSQGAEIYGVSADSVEDQAKFHANHHLNFTLLADPKKDIIKLYGTKMKLLGMSKRWTFIIDPNLKIREIEKDVDPAFDAIAVAKKISELKAKPN